MPGHKGGHDENCTIRTRRKLIDAGLAAPESVLSLERVAARYAVAITPDLADLIDRADPNDPIARQFVPDIAELATTPTSADPIGDNVHSPVEGIVHPLSGSRAAQAGECLRGLLPLLFPPRRWSDPAGRC